MHLKCQVYRRQDPSISVDLSEVLTISESKGACRGLIQQWSFVAAMWIALKPI